MRFITSDAGRTVPYNTTNQRIVEEFVSEQERRAPYCVASE